MYLKIDGLPAIEGEATAKGYERQIEVLSWGWGLANPVTVGSGIGLTAGKVSMSELTIMKNADSATPRLIEQGSSGKHAPRRF